MRHIIENVPLDSSQCGFYPINTFLGPSYSDHDVKVIP